MIKSPVRAFPSRVRLPCSAAWASPVSASSPAVSAARNNPARRRWATPYTLLRKPSPPSPSPTLRERGRGTHPFFPSPKNRGGECLFWLLGSPSPRIGDREAEGCHKAEAGAVALPTFAVHCRPDPSSGDRG